MPQTIGPFNKNLNRRVAHFILKRASKVYVRDLVYEDELKKMNIPFELKLDVSYYMQPKVYEMDVLPNAIGINVSGLTYYNNYRNLAGRFNNYGGLLIAIIEAFQKLNIPIYLVPHTYDFDHPEVDSDDLQACKDIYKKLNNKQLVHVVNRNMNAPEVKYIISRFTFFIGTRMHANFAAIYSNIPVYGLSYSYKFSGSFNRYGLTENYTSVIDLAENDIKNVVDKIVHAYLNREKQSIHLV